MYRWHVIVAVFYHIITIVIPFAFGLVVAEVKAESLGVTFTPVFARGVPGPTPTST